MADRLRDPPFHTLERTDDEARLALEVGADCPWLEGHFPGTPVVPGVVLLRWAITAGRDAWQGLETVSAVANLKFRRPVMPPARLLLHLEKHPEERRLAFRWALDGDGGGDCAGGVVRFA